MRKVLPITVALVVVTLLTGCLQRPPVVPTPTPSATPIFASEDEALAAAKAAYERYNAMSDIVAAEGGAEPQRMAEFVTPTWLPQEIDAFERFAKSGNHQAGSTRITNVRLQQVTFSEDAVLVTMYACLDLSQVRILDSANVDVTPPERPNSVSTAVTIELDRDSGRLSGSEPWSGESVC